MNRPLLAICDTERDYCRRLDEYLRDHLNLSFEICSFTDAEIFKEFAEKKIPALTVLSQSVYASLSDKGMMREMRNVLVLDEAGSYVNENVGQEEEKNVIHMSKYLPAGRIIDGILDFCVKIPEGIGNLDAEKGAGKVKLLGLFSPLSRCGQTALAVKICEELAKHGKTMLLNFDSFSMVTEIMGHDAEEDITDLLYYAECEEAKFSVYLERIKRAARGFDFIPPAKTASQIKEITFERILSLSKLLSETAGYEYIVLDLSEFPDGLCDILRACDRVFTIVGESRTESYKITQYTKVLSQNGYDDILANTVRCLLPDEGSYDELSAYASNMLVREGIISE
ncbi:MAG: hypothetical protein J5802_12645 [Butyrivibrio sp.]|nr:hypothetical protein [Butyrivibrio sp.]